jgi:hypothetical protein
LVNKEGLGKEKEKEKERKEEEKLTEEKGEVLKELKGSVAKTKSLALKLFVLSTALGMINKAKTLEEALELTDGEKQYFSFEGKVMKCDGYFSLDKIEPEIWWFLLLGLLLTLTFTVILSSYWPILFSN